MRILVVEDDELIAQALKLLLAEYSYGVDLTPDGQRGLEMLNAFEYDLLILDLLLPDIDGVSLCQKLRAQGCLMPILLVTGQSDVKRKTAALNAGADDYVVKPFDDGELIARVQALLRRGTGVKSPTLTWGNLRLNPGRRRVDYQDQELIFTPKEYALLELFLRYSDRIFSAKAILNQVWTADDYPGEETVRTHIKCLRQKLKAVGAPSDLIETVHRVGYRLNPLCRNLDNGVSVSKMQNSSGAGTCILAVVSDYNHGSLWQAAAADKGLHLVLLNQYAEFWSALESCTPALLILSYELGETSGLDICRTLRQKSSWQSIPIIFLLAKKNVDAIQQVFAAGASDMVVQPIAGPELNARITHHLRLAALA